MKILHFIYDDMNNPWLGGGGAIRNYEIYKRLAKKHEIIVITANYPYAKSEMKENISYRRIGSGFNYLISRITYSIFAPITIINTEFDLLIDDFTPYSPIFPWLFTSKPIIASIQASLDLYDIHARRKYGLFGLIPSFILKNVLNKYKNRILVSQTLLNQLVDLNLLDGRNKIIPNGAGYSLSRQIYPNENFILFMGRLQIYEKGLDLLLDAFKLFYQDFNNIKLIIAGDGRDRNKLEKLIEKMPNVEYIGKINGVEKERALNSCLFVCLPSRFESWNMVAIEAQANGKPVLGTNIPGLQDSVIDGETGILVEADNHEKLAESMKVLSGNNEIRNRLGDNARKWARNFDWDNIAREQEGFYIEILEKETERRSEDIKR